MDDDHQLPPQGVFLHAVLRHLAEHPDGDRRNNVHEAMPKLVGLSESQRMDRLASGKPRYHYRSGWGLSMLKAAGYVDSPASGVWRITSRGRELLAAHPHGFNEDTARQVIRESKKDAPPEGPGPEPRTVAPQQPPDERIDDAVTEVEQGVAQDLLERIAQAPPAFFEQLVLDLLHALGYGAGAADSRRLGGVGDGGLDGVIALDRLGLEKVYVQAKRWQGSVGRPEVQAFFGALAGRHARKGVYRP